ncbi:hypothetical protein EYF80_032019 [Liparis tanakae]|uniref:Uncharacterized protein n=1 Tax=Liparis tanakae TaxID=230148 RepID=A0A4Z2GWS6_9TELE|nr:hypothetical protein EYF80_032019 [Liparis tanakae]
MTLVNFIKWTRCKWRIGSSRARKDIFAGSAAGRLTSRDGFHLQAETQRCSEVPIFECGSMRPVIDPFGVCFGAKKIKVHCVAYRLWKHTASCH